MAILAPIRDRLCYPAGYSPGIDPTHVAVRKFLRFSGAASGSNFIRLDKLPIKGTIAATITGGIHGIIGPYIRNAGTTGKVTFAGNSIVAPTSCTLAAVFIDGAAGGNGIIINITSAAAACPMFWKSSSDNNLHLGSDTGAPELNSGIAIVAGVPYFAAASYALNGAGFVNFVVTNLLTGQIQQASIANTFAATASNGTYCIAGDGSSDAANISVAAAMYSTAGLNPSDLLAWAGDPWAFWYPDIYAMDDFMVGSSFIPPSATPLGASLMPMMGVG